MSACAAVVFGAAASQALASGWSPLTGIDPYSTIADVSCSSSSFCAATDDAGYVVTFNGNRWGAATKVDNSYGHFVSISCPSSSFCAAVDGDGNAATFNGHSWSGLTKLDPGVPLSGVSCPSASFCMAADPEGNYSVYSGGSWSHIENYGSYVGGAVSCPAASYCFTVGGSGGNDVIFTYSGGSWNTQPGPFVTSLSCPSVSFCAGLDDSGDVFTYNGSGWSSPQMFPNASMPLLSISCPASGFCMGVNGPDAFTYEGGAWGGRTSLPVPHGGGLNQISCASSTFCVASSNHCNCVSILGGPPGFGPPPGVRITGVTPGTRTARFRFKSIGKATGFQCALVPPPLRKHRHPHFVACTSPKTYRHLKLGEYAFLVRALSKNGPGPAATRVFYA